MTDTYVIDAATGKATIVKDPQAVLDYTFNWTAWLDDITDALASHLVTADAGITVDSSSIVGKTVVAWISGGTVGTTYRVACKVTTSGGRTDERSIFIKVKER